MDPLGAALRGPPGGAPEAKRTAFVIGNVGKLGAELLNVVLEDRAYDQVGVAIERPMHVTMARLRPVPCPAPGRPWDPAAALGRKVDDVFLCIEPRAASFWKTVQPYVALDSVGAVSLARELAARGARRALVVTPLEALEQMGATPALRNADEVDLIAAGFERLVLVRPTRDAQRPATEGFLERLGAGVARTLGGYMTPRHLRPIRVRKAALAAMSALGAAGTGVEIIGAERLRELAGEPVERGGY